MKMTSEKLSELEKLLNAVTNRAFDCGAHPDGGSSEYAALLIKLDAAKEAVVSFAKQIAS